MLQVGKEQLAQRMYQAWSLSAKRNRLRDPKVLSWDEIGDKQRQCWLDTAEAAAKMLVEATEASPA